MAEGIAPLAHQPRNVWVVSIIHPGAVVRGAWAAEPQQFEYLKRARGLAGGSWEPLAHDKLISRFNLSPTAPAVRAYVNTALRERGTYAVDIECAGRHLVCVGICRLGSLDGIVVRLRGPGGAPMWGAELPEVVDALYEFLSAPEVGKWFHNGQAFDVPYLQYQGFEVEGFVGDTMLLQRYMFPEMGAGLQECGIFYLGTPAWKYLAKDLNPDEAEDGK